MLGQDEGRAARSAQPCNAGRSATAELERLFPAHEQRRPARTAKGTPRIGLHDPPCAQQPRSSHLGQKARGRDVELAPKGIPKPQVDSLLHVVPSDDQPRRYSRRAAAIKPALEMRATSGPSNRRRSREHPSGCRLRRLPIDGQVANDRVPLDALAVRDVTVDGE
jgi:hypothetical protein